MLFTNLQKNQHRLNAQEHDILKYIRENIDGIKDDTLKTVAAALYVSPNTIVRLAKKLEFKGYSELKMAVVLDRMQKPLSRKQDGLTLKEQIEQTDALLSDEIVEKIVTILHHSQHVYFFACGPSKYPCEEMKEKLRICGIEASLYYEPHVMKQRAKQLKNGDTLVVVSLSGETKTPLEAMKIAKITEATIVSLTGFSQNSISKLADYSLYTFYEELRLNEMDVSSRLGIYYVLNYLFDSLI